MTTPINDPEKQAAVSAADRQYVFHSWSAQGAISPMPIASGSGSRFWDHAGKVYLDFSSQLVFTNIGHQHPKVIKAIQTQAEVLTTIAPQHANEARNEAAQRIVELAGSNFAKVFFTNAGADAVENAIRMARMHTHKHKVLSTYRSYHGNTGAAINATGDPRRFPNEFAFGHVHFWGPYLYRTAFWAKDEGEECQRALEHLEQTIIFEGPNTIAAILLESIPGTAGVLMPPKGYLEGVRALCDKYDVILIFDEVKTGLTAGAHGASARLGVQPDLITLAKSIGGGLPLAAFGGKKKYMDYVTNGKMAHFGTFNGNPLAMAGVRAIDRICTTQAMEKAEALNMQALTRISAIIDEYQLPAHTVGFGVKGCVTWSTTPVRNYRDYKATDFGIAEAHWLFALNRGIITPPGLDEQWLISLAHGQTEIDLLVEDFREFAKALRS